MQYNPSFVGHRPILNDDDKQWLHQLASRYPLEQFKKDTRSYEETIVDFVYTSAKIEGNTYDRVDTDNLLRLGVTAGGKRYSDAIMLVNLRNAFDKVMAADALTNLNLDYICDLHQILMRDLLPIHEQGIVRTSAVTIGATTYEPPADSLRLRSEINFILQEAIQYTCPFEKAIYLHCNLAYLQYFRDGNKRTSRMIQTAALVQANILPLFFNDTLIGQYQRATIQYYETGQYAPYVLFFKENYKLAISKLLGDSVPALHADETEEFERRVSDLPNLKHAKGPAYVFWQIAQHAISACNTAHAVNWPDIERQAILESIAKHGHAPNDVATAICKHSPGACSSQKQQAILDDIKRLAANLQGEFLKLKK